MVDLTKPHYGSYMIDPMLPSNENCDYATMKALKFKIKLLCLLRAIRLLKKVHETYLPYQ